EDARVVVGPAGGEELVAGFVVVHRDLVESPRGRVEARGNDLPSGREAAAQQRERGRKVGEDRIDVARDLERAVRDRAAAEAVRARREIAVDDRRAAR